MTAQFSEQKSWRLALAGALVVLAGWSVVKPAVAAEPAAAKAAPESADETPLIGKDGLAAWQAKKGGAPGEWKEVGEVALDPQQPGKLTSSAGQGILINGAGKTVNIYSKAELGDVSLHLEFCIPKGSNSGVYLQGRYEIQILDSFGKEGALEYGDCGGVYEVGARPNGKGGRPPRVNASLPPGEWQSFDIEFRAPRFDEAGKKIANALFVRVQHNGKLIHENVEVLAPTRAAGFSNEQPTGPLMIQGDHGPVAVRNVHFRLLPPAATK